MIPPDFHRGLSGLSTTNICNSSECVTPALGVVSLHLNSIIAPYCFRSAMSKGGISPPGEGTLIKRARSGSPPSNELVISSSGDDRQKGLIRSIKRTSNLEAPIISLSGAHSVSPQLARVRVSLSPAFFAKGEIVSCRFDPTGQHIAACSTDRSVCACFAGLCFVHCTYCFYAIALWRTYPPNTNYGLLTSLHKAPILDLQWSLYSPTLYTVGADHILNMTNVTTGQRIKKIRAHRGIINTLDRTMAGGAGIELVATGSDDGTVRIWEGGEEGDKTSVAVFEIGCPVTSVCWSADGQNVFIGALDNEIHVRATSHNFPPFLALNNVVVPSRCMTCGSASKFTRSWAIQTRQLR